MADLMVDYIISLDGYGAAEGWPGYWGMESKEYLDWVGQDEGLNRTALMGATTYRLMSGFAAEMGIFISCIFTKNIEYLHAAFDIKIHMWIN